MEQEKQITYEELEQALKDIEDSVNNWRWYIEHGATNRDFCNEIDNLRTNTDYFIKLIHDFSNQETLKEMERLQSDIF